MGRGDGHRLIFISHSGQDTWVARQIAREIERYGASCFLDEAEIEVGADFERDILAALERADEILLLLTVETPRMSYTRADWRRPVGITQIFLSYPAKDQDWAQDFARNLQAHGIDVWLDRHVEGGDSWVETLEQALEESTAVAFLLDPDNTKSPSMLFEWGAALASKKKVILIVSEDVDLSQLPALLKDRAHLRKESPGKAAEEVVNTLRAA